jgi:hypothetical protein
MTRGVVGVLLLGVTGFLLEFPGTRLATSAEMSESFGGAWCKNPSPVDSGCTACLDNGNGGSVKCLNSQQGFELTSYFNEHLHLGQETADRLSDCGGDAYVYDEPGCVGSFLTLPCGRKYSNAYYTGVTATGRCPADAGGGGS